MAKEKVVSPMPFPHDRPACIVVPAGGERWLEMFIVQVPGRMAQVSEASYLNFLAERVAWMLRRSGEEEEAMERLWDALKASRLARKQPRTSTPGLFCIDCIATNAIFLSRIRSTLHEFPIETRGGDNTAVTVLLRTGIDEWIASMRAWAAATPGRRRGAAAH